MLHRFCGIDFGFFVRLRHGQIVLWHLLVTWSHPSYAIWWKGRRLWVRLDQTREVG